MLAYGFEAYDNKDYARALEMFTTAWNKVGYDEAALMLARLHDLGPFHAATKARRTRCAR
jgi:hypothetical protein